MKQRRHQLTLYALLLVALGIIFVKKPRPARMQAVNSAPVATPEAPAPASVPAWSQTIRETEVPAVTDDKTEAVTPPEETTIAAVIESIDPMKSEDFTRAKRELSRRPAAEVSAFFLSDLRKLGADHGFERDRLIMLANSMQLPTDLPLWEDLALRTTPRYSNENELRNPPHPTLESRFVDIEQLQAIRNIGLLARDNRDARRVLMKIVLTPDKSAHRPLHRQEAYQALREHDLAAALRVLKQLPADDELLKRL